MLVYAPSVEEAILSVPIYPCAAKEEGDHYKRFYKGSGTHDGYQFPIDKLVAAVMDNGASSLALQQRMRFLGIQVLAFYNATRTL